VAFLLGLVVTGWSGGFTTVLPQLEYGMMIDTLGSEFSAPFAGGSYYLWVATCFSLVFGTCGLPHVLVRFYTVKNERVARWSCTWGLFFISLLYLSAPAFAAVGTALYGGEEVGAVYGDPGMTSAAGDVLVVLAAQLAGLPSWFVGFVAAGGIAAAVATTAGLFIAASSAISHDIYANIINEDATQRQQVLVGRLSIILIGLLTIIFALNPQQPIAALVGFAFSLAAIVLFPMFFLGLWWENTNPAGCAQRYDDRHHRLVHPHVERGELRPHRRWTRHRRHLDVDARHRLGARRHAHRVRGHDHRLARDQ